MSSIERLPKVNSRKEFMDCLSSMIIPPKEESEDGEQRGRMRELKTYLIESNKGFPSEIHGDNFTTVMENTGIDDLKILYARNQRGEPYASFFVDLADRRFISLYTNSEAKDTHFFHSQLAKLHKYSFDHTWLTTGMLKDVAGVGGNRIDGVGISYKDIFANKDYSEEPDEGWRVDISGGKMAGRALQLISGDEVIKKRSAYDRVRILRGDKQSLTDFVTDDLDYNGIFAIRTGKSVYDHVTLVELVKEKYQKQMKTIEDNSIGLRQINNRMLYEGKAFDFEFKRNISDWELFLDKMFNSSQPFRMWGLKEKVEEGYYSILAVDLHTGDPVDLEIANNFMRVYLPKGSCGNVVLRLFVNLQQNFDSTISCKEII